MTDTAEFFSRSLLSEARRHLNRSTQKRAEGATEQALEHLDRVEELLNAHHKTRTFPRLSPTEMREYRVLENKSGGNGGMGRHLTDEEFRRYKYLGNKAVGNEE